MIVCWSNICRAAASAAEHLAAGLRGGDEKTRQAEQCKGEGKQKGPGHGDLPDLLLRLSRPRLPAPADGNPRDLVGSPCKNEKSPTRVT